MRAVLLCLLSLPACSSLLGIDDVSLGTPTSSTVHGTSMTLRYASSTQMVMEPQDLRNFVLQAYAPDTSESGFRIIDGVGTQDGTFTIPDVPGGSYYLLILPPGSPLPHFFETSSRTPEIGGVALGRDDGAVASAGTPVTFHVSGMTATAVGDVVSVESRSTGVTVAVPGLPLGTTQLDPFTVDWKPLARPLLSAARGDDLLVLHTHRTPLSVFPASAFANATTIADAFTTNMVSLTDGQAASVPGTFTPATVSGSLKIQADPSSYLDGLDVPFHQPVNMGVSLDAGFADRSTRGASIVSFGAGLSFSQSFDVPYYDPFPSSATRIASSFIGLDFTFAARGAGHHEHFQINASSSQPATATFFASAAVPAPRSIRIGGVDASRAGAVPFDEVHALPIQWSAVTGVSHYLVVVAHLADTVTVREVDITALIETTATHASIPASLLKAGDLYVFEVASVLDGRLYADGALQRKELGNAHREAITARLLLSSTCGNGVVDAVYEECDTRGVEDATCNADCTRPVCGDGIVNAAAHEVCDDVVDSLVCDADCTAVVCGDGHVNTVAGEACDDGNATNGDGCSSSCAVDPGFTCTGAPSVCTHM